ncbi:hypothetical protein LINPERPRIM_LOCUS28795 [Linum perenne]
MSSSSRRNHHSSDGYDYHHALKSEDVKQRERTSNSSRVCVKFGSQKICSDNVDTVAEEFIRLKHKKFEASKTMSVNYG